MPDFNKGDFTQQGVAGHVNANLRLNEKRLVNIDLTSNEEAEGCTITGTVKDLLNDKVYGIGSGVSGNIEITENGENINVAPYATATVNVAGGGGDFTIATLTINASEGSYPGGVDCACAYEADDPYPATSYWQGTVIDPGTNTLKVILYKGVAAAKISLKVISMSGNITNTGGLFYDITGDCVINVEPGEPSPPSI